jgi:hypothetical protein
MENNTTVDKMVLVLPVSNLMLEEKDILNECGSNHAQPIQDVSPNKRQSK